MKPGADGTLHMAGEAPNLSSVQLFVQSLSGKREIEGEGISITLDPQLRYLSINRRSIYFEVSARVLAQDGIDITYSTSKDEGEISATQVGMANIRELELR